MKTEYFFHHMRKRAMAHVMKQGGRPCRRAVLFVDAMLFAEAIQHPTHQMKCAKRMSKARVFRALVGVEPEAQLLDASQPLKLRCVDQVHDQGAFVVVGAKPNDVVNWIAIDSFRHGAILITANTPEGNLRGVGPRPTAGRHYLAHCY